MHYLFEVELNYGQFNIRFFFFNMYFFWHPLHACTYKWVNG